MTNRTAIVTGAAQGIGEAAARRLVREGVTRLLLIDWQDESLRLVAESLTNENVQADTLCIDLRNAEAVCDEVARAADALGGVDALINAAGTTERGGLLDTDPTAFDRIFGLNVRAPFFLMQVVAPRMRKGGVIVNICSMLAYGGPPFLLAYSASKAALVALTKGAANTLKRDGLHVFGINLGWTWTPSEQEVQTKVHGLADDWYETFGARQPFGRLLFPEDPAGLIAFLTSSDAAMMTGAIIDLDQYVAGTVEDNPGA
ncbi:NAD(P)-dependent dehydrogenase (short-subunit alcohol dehydrogenase family) [Aliiruegeria haliotis]|uniref:NAD(P)-dependent dehydrogenase (Short-subunit alcohol dehydrogenase family) n=1 Tax=Aliiruegeria haliotis TaxID=1280846 RepID=A0A2T0RM39_9RHOB|nr:oxidoreductase [Aliiruegeria haliotis]PRY22201.1 NAD(P)-dependent dehydrogenase (short-subunit alcohol dehydrogenase family) [Aliiruegeria haliotis]